MPRAELLSISYLYGGPVVGDNYDLVVDTAAGQFKKLLPKLLKCGLESVNTGCRSEDHAWDTFRDRMMWIDETGKISSNYSSDCIAQHLTGQPMPIGKTHHGQWKVSFKILRKFRPNPEGGALCPYKGLAE